jgi:hypothetical protein
MENSKRTTVYFAAAVHKALRLRAAASDRSISEMVNDAVRAALAEDASDLEAFAERRGEKSVSFETFVGGLKGRGRIEDPRRKRPGRRPKLSVRQPTRP